MPCGYDCRKTLLDCNGEIMEAMNNVPLVAVNGGLSHEAMKAFNEMKPRWAKEYLDWKAEYVFNDPGASNS